tara:strand:+ start:8109 stop:8813 length:705 start_codon:yes stop_codon:yes gene_type:complete
MYNLPIPCIILARKNSRELKNKNRHTFAKKTLIEHSIDYAKKSKYVTHIIISTDDKIINKIALKNKCISIYPRPKNLSNNKSKSEPALKHALDYFISKFGKIDIYSYLQVTEPIRPKGILDKCIINLLTNSNFDSSFAGYEFHKNFWYFKKKFIKLNKSKVDHLPRQKREVIYREDTGIALASRYKFILKGKRIGPRVKIEPYNDFSGLIDIHNKNDILLANIILKLIKRKSLK